jgi:hypothetical protein
MGAKITIDSATLANKALEVIEAHFLFGIGYDRIEAVVHPQSIVHSMVEFVDGSVLAQMGFPTMELPSCTRSPPRRLPYPARRFDPVAAGALTFEPLREDASPPSPSASRRGAPVGGARGLQRRQRGRRRRIPGGPDLLPGDRRRHRARARRWPGEPVDTLDAVLERTAGPAAPPNLHRDTRAVLTLLAFLVVIGVLVFVHELGHLIAAKSVDIEVPRFSIGFGPVIWGFTGARRST